MKPNAFVGLSIEGITVHARVGNEWHKAGHVPLDSPDLHAALAPLIADVETATGGPIRSKINIPNDQIKFITVPAVSGSPSDQSAVVSTAMEGQTPYAVDDLAIDWTTRADTTSIAAVALETLNEAESFAQEHGLNPVSFVASPPEGSFDGANGAQEPYFGTAPSAASLLGAGATVEPDQTPLAMKDRLEIAPPVVAPKVETTPEPAPEPEPKQETPAAAAKAEDAPNAQTPASSAEDTAPPVAFSTKRTVPLDENLEPQVVAPLQSSEGRPPALGGASRTEPPAPKATLQNPADPPEPPPNAPPVTGHPDGAAPVSADAMAASLDAPTKEDPFGTLPPARAARPRFLALILTAVLLAFLLVVALLAGGWDTASLSRLWSSETTQTAALPSDGAVDSAALDPNDPAFTSPSSEELADAESEPADLDGADLQPREATLIADPSAAPQRREQPAPVPSMSLDDARAAYAQTGIWQRAPSPQLLPSASELDSLYVASLDPSIGVSDAVALPSVRRLLGDDLPGRLSNPTAAGEAFVFGPDGLVIPSPQGTLSPDGITVFSGKPPLVPPVRDVAQAPVVEPDNALAELRPKARPENLSDGNEREILGGYTRTELAKLRPSLRPRGLVPAPAPAPTPEPEVAAAPPEDNNPSLVPIDPKPADVPETTPPVQAAPKPKGTAQAVARSITPKPRPRNFDREVARQKEAAQPKDNGRAVASVAPRTVKPSGKTPPTVARNATSKNEINLRRVNLIGVYGKTSSRRALVRLSNGRYVRVKVGDRMDGGKVAAISRSELRYVKRGQTVRLKVPSS